MEERDDFLQKKKLAPEEEFRHFKNVVKSLMKDASKVLAEMESLLDGAEIEEKSSLLEHISLLDHYLDYTRRLAESDTVGARIQERENVLAL